MNDSLQIARLERALVTMARIVSMPSFDIYLPVFERIERELDEAQARRASLQRARSIARRVDRS